MNDKEDHGVGRVKGAGPVPKALGDAAVPRELPMLAQRRLTTALLGMWIAMLTSAACAEVIILKDGRRIEGKILQETDEAIEVQIVKYGITMTQTVQRPQIKSIVKDESGKEEEDKAEDKGKAKEEEPREEGKKEAAPADKPVAGEADGEDEGETGGAGATLIEVDLRMALYEPLIRDSFEDGTTKLEPKSRGGFFLLVPFRYEAAEEPYVVTARKLNFTADQGTARCRGLVPLDAKPVQAKAPAQRADDSSDDEELFEVRAVRSAPLYERATIYEDDDRLMVSFFDLPKSQAQTVQPSTPRPSTPRTGRSRGRSAPSPRGGYTGRPSPQPKQEGPRPKRGYERSHEKEKAQSEEKDLKVRPPEKSATASSPASSRSKKETTLPKDGKPGSGWLAMVLEVSSEASAITVHLSQDRKAMIDLRLLDVLGRKAGGGGGQKSVEELELVEQLTRFAGHDSPLMSRLAVEELIRLRGASPRQPVPPSDKKSGEVVLDKRSELMESGLLTALGSKDERTQRLAWRAITSGTALPKAAEEMIAKLERPEVSAAVLKLAESEIKSESSRLVDSQTGQAARMPAPGRGMQAAASAGAYQPVGLPESSVPQGVWEVLGAFMRIKDEKLAAQAVAIALSNGTRQGIALLGSGHAQVGVRAARLLDKAPSAVVKHEAFRVVLSGTCAMKTRQGAEDLLVTLATLAQRMAASDDAIKVLSPADPVMSVVLSLRDNPEWQLRALAILPWCQIDAALDAQGIDKWLAEMTDKLVAQDVQDATYQLIASKWRPRELPELNAPGRAPAAGAQPTPGGTPPAGGQPRGSLGDAREGPVEKFLLQGLSRASDAVRPVIMDAFLRAGRNDVVLSQLEGTDPPTCAALVKRVCQMTSQLPPSLVPGEPSRFTPLGLMMGLGARVKDTAFQDRLIASLSDIMSSGAGANAWRYALAFKQQLVWDVVYDLCTTSDAGAADGARKVVAETFGLLGDERTALASLKDRTALAGKLSDYDKQRGGKPVGKYHGLVLCEILQPSFNLVLDKPDDNGAKERGGKITDLTWNRRIIGVEPGMLDVTVGQDRKIEVKLGRTIVGTGQAPSSKEDKAASKPSERPAAARPEMAALAEALRKQRAGQPGAPKPATPEPAAAEQVPVAFDIHVPKLVAAISSASEPKTGLPVMEIPKPAQPIRSPGAGQPGEPKEGAEPADPNVIPMAYLAFGTRQGAMTLSDGRAPTLDKPDVRVDANGKIIRGTNPIPILVKIQVFLEPVRSESTKN